DKERISLSYRQLIPDPWQSVEERYEIESRHKGIVSSITDYGAFVELEPGIEGLVHVSEMTWSKRAKHPNKIVRVGQELEVQVLRIDQRDKRVSLGMRQVMSNPWETIYERYPIGTRVKGRVRNMTDFGAFVELEEGVDGLVHLSDITWSKKLKHPSEALKKNQEVEAVVTGINTEARRMSLSMKELQPKAWDAFVTEHKPGDVVKGKISRFANFGVFVELADDLEGLCHISELSEERIDKPESVFQVGQEMDFKILRIEPDVQKIGLSARAVGKEDEPAVDSKTYSTEAKGGMASLGELANIFRNRREE
ncbi:MAG: S1 RNA-binding domain-containing protein, partial [Pyrinomonadaceae bacterium]|nr:S1 RNA-binding domain-containing protein [Pyrinomonadaceae bacterium]